MRALVSEKTTGRVVAIYDIPLAINEAELLETVFGRAAVLYDALPFAGQAEETIGMKVDSVSKMLVKNPNAELTLMEQNDKLRIENARLLEEVQAKTLPPQ